MTYGLVLVRQARFLCNSEQPQQQHMYRVEQVKRVLNLFGKLLVLKAALFAVIQENQRQCQQGERLQDLPTGNGRHRIGFSLQGMRSTVRQTHS